MLFSLFQMPHGYDPAEDDRIIEKSLRQAELADELGFHGVWLSEHLFTGTSVFGDPIVYATAVAGRTKRIEIGFGVIQLALHHPVRLAVQLALLDQLSKGRLRVGIARGSAFNEWEYRAFGLTLEEGRARFNEGLDLLLQSWNTDDLTFRGEYFQVDVPGIRPRPYQQPHPPIYRSALTPESTAEIGRLGYPILFPRLTGPTIRDRLTTYADAMRGAGFDEQRVARQVSEAGFLKNVYVAPTDEEAWADVEEPIKRQMRAVEHNRRRFFNKEAAAAGLDIADQRTEEETVRVSETMQRGLIVGSPATVTAHLRDLQSYGLNHVLATVDWGDIPQEKVERSLRYVAKEVLPAIG